MSAPAPNELGLNVVAEWFKTNRYNQWIPNLPDDWCAVDVVGEWLKGEDAAILLWPVAWCHVERHANELAPASTAAPWAVVEAAVVRKPRRRLIWSMMALAFTMAFGGVS